MLNCNKYLTVNLITKYLLKLKNRVLEYDKPMGN